MTTPGPRAPRRYELRLRGHLDEYWSTWLGGFAITRHGDGTTTLRGAVADQSELHGLLRKVRDLGITLVSVTALDAAPTHRTSGTADPATALTQQHDH